jgi:hypothetical protein
VAGTAGAPIWAAAVLENGMFDNPTINAAKSANQFFFMGMYP